MGGCFPLLLGKKEAQKPHPMLRIFDRLSIEIDHQLRNVDQGSLSSIQVIHSISMGRSKGGSSRNILGETSQQSTRKEEKTLPSNSIHFQTLARHADELQTPPSDQCNIQEYMLPHSLTCSQHAFPLSFSLKSLAYCPDLHICPWFH